MVNVNKLKAKMVEIGINVEWLAKEINLDRTTLYRRLNNPEEFTIREVTKIALVLNLTKDEVNDIFFASNVA